MSLQFTFRIKNNTISGIVPETCRAIYEVLRDDFLRCPQNEDEWKEVAELFWSRWQFPHTLGAIDGKHIRIKPPPNSGSKFFNYKQYFSIVLMAVADSAYKFLYVDVGCQGRISDGGVFSHTTLSKALEARNARLPDARPLPLMDAGSTDVPYFFVGDDAFPLREFLMKPYPQRNLDDDKRIFNYRLSRARRVVENAFGILANRWRVLLTPILVHPDKVENLVLAVCALHNWLRVRLPSFTNHLVDDEDENGLVQGEWHRDTPMEPLEPLRGNHALQVGKRQRDILCHFVSNQGAVSWQERVAFR